ncbi:MAG: RagB/SusD family nutrient uptake outer membrane protein [Tannerella sp.]|jgi:hypothetical protein|nr:RagB/SusD family nutrient uptake outer membrane protein [Tannerella sp.]
MKTNIIKFSIFFLTCCSVISCEFLDIVPEKNGTIEYAFGEKKRALGYLATCYSFLPQMENEGASPGRTVGPESFQYHPAENNGNLITMQGNNITSPYMNYWDGGGGVASGKGNSKDIFTALRCCNIFLENVNDVPDLNSYERASWAAEVKFLKAFYHWWLIQLYGPIPVIRENLPIDASPSEVQIFREPLDDAIAYITQLLDEAVADLPDVVETDIVDMGRITKPIALAMKAKILTYYASPFYNGNVSYSNFVDRRGAHLFPQTKDEGKWVKALAACKEAIDYCGNLGYRLMEFEVPLGAPMSDSTKYVLTPQAVITTPWNSELIWGLSKADVNTVQSNCMPMLDNSYQVASIRARFAPTLSVAETFYSSHGVPIDEDKDWTVAHNWYNDRYQTAAGDDAHQYVITKNFETARLHFNREYRFYGSIAFDGGLWYGGGVTNPSENNQITVLGKLGQVAGRKGIERYSVTGYHIKKLVSVNTAAPNNSFSSQKYAWPVIRLADLYLLYSEARNETLDAPDDSVYMYVDKVRERAGIPTVQTSWSNWSNNPEKYKRKEGMRDIIHQERLIELAFEGHYYFDIKRWSGGAQRARYDIMTLMNNPIKGWNIDGSTTTDYYVVRNVCVPQFSLRDYLWPVKESTLTVNGNLVQNPGW